MKLFRLWRRKTIKPGKEFALDKRSSLAAKQRISRFMTGRRPWNKGVGLEDSRIRKGIKTRKEFAKLRHLIQLVYTFKEV